MLWKNWATGRIFLSAGVFDPYSKKYNKNDVHAAIIGLSIYQSKCERTAVNGITAFFDLTEFQMKHQLFWKLDDLKRIADLMNVRNEADSRRSVWLQGLRDSSQIVSMDANELG